MRAADLAAAEVACGARGGGRSAGLAAAFAAAESCARCRAGLRPSAPVVPRRALSLSISSVRSGRQRAGRVAAAGSWGSRRWPAHGGRREVWWTVDRFQKTLGAYSEKALREGSGRQVVFQES